MCAFGRVLVLVQGAAGLLPDVSGSLSVGACVLVSLQAAAGCCISDVYDSVRSNWSVGAGVMLPTNIFCILLLFGVYAGAIPSASHVCVEGLPSLVQIGLWTIHTL